MENSQDRLNDVFFYGLYMDPTVLESKGVKPRNPRKGVVKGYQLRIGKMATLLRQGNAEAHGVIYSLTHDEIDQLYRGSGLNMYVAESLLAITQSNQTLPVLCCNLLNPPEPQETAQAYSLHGEDRTIYGIKVEALI